MENGLTYKTAGVDIDEGEEMVRRIKPLVRKTFNERVLTDIGGFGGLFDARFPSMDFPVLVSSTDGVGTKIKVAIEANRHNSVGSDLVNHCVNDILVCGARPLFFLDYFATGKLSADIGTAVVEGFADACQKNGCALIGGETAEMPGLYAKDDYDLAGTIVGVVDRSRLLSRENVLRGDILIGLRSNGLHTNGYSLARKALFERGGYTIHSMPHELGKVALSDALLQVHRSYLTPVMAVLENETLSGAVHALSHITGGGIVGNTSRVLPEGASLDIDWTAWPRPAIFDLIQAAGNVPEEDMRRTFNLGIGLIAIVDPSVVDQVISSFREAGEEPVVMGRVS